MSSGPDNVTTTTRTDPSPLLTGSISSAIGGANQLFQNSDIPESMRRNVAGLDALFNRGQTGSGVVDAAQDLTTRTLQGDFLSPDTNPFLQQTFDRAADLTRTRLDSEFAGAGRNLGAAMPARSEELQTLASNIFGGNFARERGIQANAVNQSLPLANQDFNDINAMIDAGNLPTDQFINRIGALAPAAGGTAVSSQPIQRNTLGNVFGGALAGSAFGPLGMLGGGLTGLFGG